jgi:hypothetical protein
LAWVGSSLVFGLLVQPLEGLLALMESASRVPICNPGIAGGAGFEAVLMETRHVKAALSAMTVKTDWRDARGIAQLLRLGWYCSGHAKSASAQEVRSLLTARKLMQGKLLDLESGIRGVLRGFGLKVGTVSRGRFEARIRELVDGHAMLKTVIGSMLAARTALQQEFAPSPHDALAGACGCCLPPVDELAWRGRHRRHHVQEWRRRSRALPTFAGCRTSLWRDAKEVPVRRARRDRLDQQGRRPPGADRAL